MNHAKRQDYAKENAFSGAGRRGGAHYRTLWVALILSTWTLAFVCGCFGARRGTIGAILARDAAGRTFVRDAPQHLAAYQAGIRRGDELLFVAGQEARSLSDADLHRLLSGTVRDEVQLTFVRQGVTVIRLELHLTPAVPYY